MSKTIWTDNNYHCKECGAVITPDLMAFENGLCEECDEELAREIEGSN